MVDLEVKYEELAERFGNRSPRSFKSYKRLSILKKFVWVLTNPSSFFNNISHEGDVIDAMTFLASCGLIGLFVSLPLVQSGQTTLPFLLMTYLILTTVASFVGAAILHLVAVVMKGSGDYIESYKVYAYGHTPLVLLGALVPVIGGIFFYPILFVLSLYTALLEITGLRILHRMEFRQAVLTIVIPLGMLFVLVYAFFAVSPEFF